MKLPKLETLFKWGRALAAAWRAYRARKGA